MIDFEHLANPEKYHTVPPRAEGEKDEQYKARLKAYVQGIKSQQAKIDELKKKLVRHRNENTWSCDAIDDIYKAMIGAADEIN